MRNCGIAGFSRNTTGLIQDVFALKKLAPLATAAATGGTSIFLGLGNNLSALVRLLGFDRTIQNYFPGRRFLPPTTRRQSSLPARRYPVPVSTISQPTGGGIINSGLSQQSNIQFKKVALQLEVVPLINSEKEVTLDILQKVDELGNRVQVDNNEIPTINTRYIKTTVSAPNCSTILLGGLVQDMTSRSQTGIPILGRIPVRWCIVPQHQKRQDAQ